MDDNYHIVDFEEYCKKCKYRKTDETEPVCNECLTYPTQYASRKPKNYKEDD